MKLSLAEQLTQLSNPAPEIDPEDAELNDVDDDDLGREHYHIPTSSKLRAAVPIELDRLYKGKQVSRKQLDEFDDEHSGGSYSGSEDGSDDGLEDEDEGSEFGSDSEGSQVEEVFNAQDEEELPSSEDEEAQDKPAKRTKSLNISSQIEQLEKDNQKMMAKLSEAAKAEVEKGKHVQGQISLWERLLDIRIRLQKPLEIGNNLPLPATFDEIESSNTEQIEAATDDVKELLNSMIDYRMVT
jgi:protein AATF/BFR2